METSVEIREAQQSPVLIDVFDKRWRFHYTPTQNLPKVLERGLYSKDFAKRINDRNFRVRSDSQDKRNVWVSPEIHYPVGETDHHGGIIGLILDVPEVMKVPHRVAPRQFVGLLQPDIVNHEEISRRIEGLTQSLGSQLGTLNIYGRDGSLYWPRRMSHEEIVEELRRKSEVQ